MNKTELDQRIDRAINEARTLAEYWTGTLHEQLIEQKLNAFTEVLFSNKEDIESQLQSLESTLAQAREQLERADNEG